MSEYKYTWQAIGPRKTVITLESDKPIDLEPYALLSEIWSMKIKKKAILKKAEEHPGQTQIDETLGKK